MTRAGLFIIIGFLFLLLIAQYCIIEAYDTINTNLLNKIDGLFKVCK